MKKILGAFIILSIFLCFIVYYSELKYHKVFKILSPVRVFVDLNSNYIFDETEPFILDDIHYINSASDYSSDSILSSLSFEQIFILEYFAKDFSERLLKNKFVKISGNDFLIKGKSYKKKLLDSGFFYNDNIDSKKLLLKRISEINVDDYVLYNVRSKKYHKLGCKNAGISKNIKLVNINNISSDAKKSKCCFKDDEIIFYDIETPDIISDNTSVLNSKLNSSSYESDNIKIYFIDFNNKFKPDNNCRTDACIALKEEINNADSSIDFAIYGFNNQPQIYNALVDAKKRGVKLRLVSNYDNAKIKYYPEIEKLKSIIPENKTNYNPDAKNKYGIMHNKFFIFDNSRVFTGSANITSTDLSGFNANYSLLINSKTVAKRYLDEFNQMYSGNFGKNKIVLDSKPIKIDSEVDVNILFSPQCLIIDNYILSLIDSAKDYIYIPSFFITHKKMQESLINAYKRGVEIKIINDATNAHTKYTIHKNLRNAGIKVKTENFAGKMHMKAMFIDDKYSVIGSMNFTSSGNKRNDENVIIIKSTEITKFFKETFIHIWNKIPSKYENFDPMAESWESIGSCFDGIDNDFDRKIDKQDEGCFPKK